MAELKLEHVLSGEHSSSAKNHVDPYVSVRTYENYPNVSDKRGRAAQGIVGFERRARNTIRIYLSNNTGT